MPPKSELLLQANSHGLLLTCSAWPGMRLGPAGCRLTADGREQPGRLQSCRRQADGWRLEWQFDSGGLRVYQQWVRETPVRWRCRSQLLNGGRKTIRFERADLLTLKSVRGTRIDLGRHLGQVRIMEQSAIHGQVRSAGQILTGSDGRLSLERTPGAFVSTLVTVFHSPAEQQGLLIGFESFDRWLGRIRGGIRTKPGKAPTVLDNVDRSTGAVGHINLTAAKLKPGQRFTEFAVELPGADLPVSPGESLELEEFILAAGTDPHALLETYADRVARRYKVKDLPEPFANWCSWYPYRLGLSEDLMLATARAAQSRHLDRLGLRFIQADLGWEKDNVPTYFEENERFPHGLAWLSRKLRGLGYELGVWKGFACVADTHPVYREHPEWLVKNDDGTPVGGGKWFWQPRCPVYSLDVTHPGAVEWVRDNLTALARKGVGYFKWDFGSSVAVKGRRFDESIACSEAAEGLRRIARVMRDALGSAGGPALFLDCTGMEAAVGIFQLLYTNYDTGNTGIGYAHLRGVYECAGVHLFKNRRWGLLQPSCLVVGLPGTLEEARIRATATFLVAGHTDLGDNLTNLPEDRWQVLLSTLPPLPTPARVADLFHPVRISAMNYVALCQGESEAARCTDEPQGGTVWHARVEAAWDDWDLVAVFNLADPPRDASGTTVPFRFEIPFGMLGLNAAATYWAHELWSGQFLGQIPVPLRPAGSYRHPGDSQALINDSAPGMLDLAFMGQAVKLLALRRPQQHPWPVGTTFHLSGGRELAEVQWDAKARELHGKLLRPPGQTGSIAVAGIPSGRTVQAFVDGRKVLPVPGANNAITIPVNTVGECTDWRVRVE